MRNTVLFILMFPIIVFAQETIDVQRPTLTESNTIVGSKIIQAESGTTLIGDSLHFNTFVRFGINDRLEFRIASNFNSPHVDFSGKILLYKGTQYLPGLSFAMFYNPKTGGQNYIFSATGSPTEHLFYTLNAGHSDGWYGILCAGYSFGTGAVFGEYMYHEAYQQLHGGVTYTIKGEVQVDINGGVQIMNNFYQPYVGAGVAFRLKPFEAKKEEEPTTEDS